jgi:outer membrane receptor protein involved in Fe transport
MAGFDLAQNWRGDLWGVETANRAGLQGRYDLLDPVALYSTVARAPVATTRSDRVRESSVAVYFENTLHWSEWMRTVAGLRADGYGFDVTSSVAANSGKTSDRIVSPKFSAVFGPWNRTEFFLNYGEGFHSNDARGTTEHVTPGEGQPTDPVTPLVKSRGSEMGARTEIVPGLQSSLALWRLSLASELVFSGDAGDTTPSRASYRRGIEWNSHYMARQWLLLDLDLSLSRAHFTQYDPVGDDIPGAIEKVASFGIGVNDLGPWSGAFQLRYFGPRPLVEDNSVRSGSTMLAYLRAGYRIDRDWKIGLDVFNLFDRKASDIDYYYRSRLMGEPAAGIDDVHFHPVEPRSVRLSVIVHF